MTGWMRPAIFGCLLFGTLQAHAATMELRDAQMSLTIQGQTTQQPIRLPYDWVRQHGGLPGEATFEIPLQLNEIPQEPWGLYLPRLGNAYEVWLNGRRLDQKGDMQNYNGADYSLVPHFVGISPGVLQKQNSFRVRIRVDAGRHGGLAPLILGPIAEAQAAFESSWRWRSLGSLLVACFSLGAGLLGLGLWLTQIDTTSEGIAKRDPIYLYCGLAELFWAVRVVVTLIEDPPLPWPWWGAVPIVTLGIWGLCMVLFGSEAVGWRAVPAVRLLRQWLWGLMLASVLVAILAYGLKYPLVITIWYAALSMIFLVFSVALLRQALRYGASSNSRVLALTVLINVVVGVRDLYFTRIAPIYPDNSMLRFASVVFGLAAIYVVMSRFRLASMQARELRANLEIRIEEKERALALSYQREEQLARVQERTQERTRVLRDMHDGVGAHISTAIRQLRSGKASSEDVLHTLLDSLDQLKLSIDAMNLPRGDVTALLANIRYRLEPRFTASDIDVQWAVEAVSPLTQLDDTAMRHLRFMVFEALSNVLQHAQASVLRIELYPHPQGGACLSVIDNGCGFVDAAVQHKGLRSLRDRAAIIGAQLAIASTPGRTAVQIVLN